MRLRGVGVAAVAVLVGACSWGGAAKPPARAKSAAAPVKQAARPKLMVNGKPADAAAILQGGVPLVRLRFAVATVPVGRNGISVEETAGETTVSRPEAIVRIKAGAKQMFVDGQSTPLTGPVVAGATGLYVPVEVLEALYPEYTVALVYEAPSQTVHLRYEAKQVAAPPPAAMPPVMPPMPQMTTGPATPPTTGPAASGPAACAPTGSARGVGTQEFGKAGAKMEIVACLPITHGCHVRTEAELKKAYEKHPNDIHLLIYDLFGPEGQQYVAQHGGQRAVVFINGKTNFELGGRKVVFEKIEDMLYAPADIVPVVEQELGAK